MATSSVHTVNGVVTTPFLSKNFQVTDQSDWLKLSISFTKKGWVAIFIYDANNQLRVQSLYINEPKTIFVTNQSQTTSFASVAGDLPTGDWRIDLLSPTYKSNPTFELSYEYGTGELDAPIIVTENWAELKDNHFELTGFDANKVYPSQNKWFKGDFHTHTTESDGKMTPIAGLTQAKEMKLDYFVATDHNIIPTKWIKDDELLVIPGVEITSSKGHFNALGLTKWVDWLPSSPDGGMETEEGMNRVISEVKESGAIFSINHPMLKPWAWEFNDTKLRDIDTIEIWNDPTYKDNPAATEEALKLWNELWNDGYRIYGIGGSDSHLLPTETYPNAEQPSVIGDPATYVLAEELSATSLLQAVRQGKTYVSRGPVLDIEIMVNNEPVDMGADLTDRSGNNGIDISYLVSYQDVKRPSSITWIQDGAVIAKDPISSTGQIQRKFSWSQAITTWLRFEIRAEDGELLAFGNPIFQGSKETTLHTWKDLMNQTFGKDDPDEFI
ncbi:hypothetical protein FZW96_07275 [Bacillus sp. BGMRC 2118]|nr:hypothetical protein FZW96_07275 [Bacillus sp. BGMRC 2118]